MLNLQGEPALNDKNQMEPLVNYNLKWYSH